MEKKKSRCSSFTIDENCIAQLEKLSEILHETKTSIVELAVKKFYEEATQGHAYYASRTVDRSEKFDVVAQFFKLSWIKSVDLVTDDNVRITLGKNDEETDEDSDLQEDCPVIQYAYWIAAISLRAPKRAVRNLLPAAFLLA